MGMNAILRLLIAALLLALPAVPSAVAQATDPPWPQKAVRIVVPFPAGGSNDALCRIVADKLSIEWKQPVVVDNKGGAGGNIGAETVFNAPADGYTLLCSAPGPLAINHNLYRTLGYRWAKFVPVSVLARSPNVITARKDLPANTAQEFIAWAKANPGKATYASQGNGSTAHLAAQMLATQAGLDLVHVPYKGESPALGDVVAGRVDIFLGTISASLRFARSGQVKYLGIAASSRSPVAPDVPAAPEIGLPKLIASAWFAVVAPPGTPDTVVQKINIDIGTALLRADVRGKFLELGAEPVGSSTYGAAMFIREEEIRWRDVIQTANVSLE
jgi:tripartite-type tricarboxylate transporter receptor subunit TctC